MGKAAVADKQCDWSWTDRSAPWTAASFREHDLRRVLPTKTLQRYWLTAKNDCNHMIDLNIRYRKTKNCISVIGCVLSVFVDYARLELSDKFLGERSVAETLRRIGRQKKTVCEQDDEYADADGCSVDQKIAQPGVTAGHKQLR